MSYEDPTEAWAIEDIDRMLDLLGAIETPGFQIATWPDRTHVDAEGNVVRQFPYPDYHPVVSEFIPLCYETSAFIDPYERLPEDPASSGSDEPPTTRILESPEDMESATLNQIRRYLVVLTRGERFCDGYIDGQFDNGCLPAAVKRLRELRAATEEKP